MRETRPYVMALHIPIHVSGDETFVATDWKRALELLRDSLSDRFERFVFIGPSLKGAEGASAQSLAPMSAESDGFAIIPSMDYACGKRGYWLRERRRWMRDVRALLRDAAVAHVGLADLYRPINHDALKLALASDAATIFVRDTDELAKHDQMVKAGLARDSVHKRIYHRLYDRCMRHAVRHADLSMLKGQMLFDRYARDARNPRSFENTSYFESEIVPEALRQARVATLSEARPLRLVYCGRLEARKGLDDAVRIVARARALGADCVFDVIGDGDQRAALEALVAREGVAEHVRFLGRRPYGPELFRELAGYDALFFTPLAEDTPRMIFDGYAAGLPLIAYDIAYVRERLRADRAVETIPLRDIDAGAQLIHALDADRGRLAALSDLARDAAWANTAEAWYRRRAEWTVEAFERHESSRA